MLTELMLRKCWIDMAIFAGFTLQDKQFCYRKLKSGVCPDDGNFCLSSLHWALIGPLPSPDIWPTNKKWERIVLLIISLNGKQLVLFSQSAVPWSASLTPILPVVPTNTDSQADFSPDWSTLIGPDPSRYCALIGGTLLCWRQGLGHNNTPQGK